jgi:hypothetical protein
MKRIFLSIFLQFISIFYLFSQEMILNGGFESPNSCSEYDTKCSPVAWYSTATNERAYGYDYDRFFAKKGHYYSSFVVADESKKEYIQTWLACPVEAGKQYRLRFYFRKVDKYRSELLLALEPLRNKKITRLEIIGHTDNKGNATYNQILSLKRAETIAQLIDNQGFYSRKNIKTEGRGATEPVAENTTEEGRQKNRRVEILMF